MIRFLVYCLSVLKETIFNKKEESDPTSIHFDAKKFIWFIAIATSFVLNVALINRLFYIAKKDIKLDKTSIEYDTCIKQLDSQNKELLIVTTNFAQYVINNSHNGKKHVDVKLSGKQ